MLEHALLEVPKNILSRLPVDVERRIEREGRDQVESIGLYSDVNEHSDVGNELVNDVLRALKNMEIMGQILRNKYGSLSRERLKEIVRTIGDVGLRLVSSITSRESILKFEDVLVERIDEIQSEGKRVEVEDVRKGFRALVIMLVLSLVERISESIGRKELDVVVKEVVREAGYYGVPIDWCVPCLGGDGRSRRSVGGKVGPIAQWGQEEEELDCTSLDFAQGAEIPQYSLDKREASAAAVWDAGIGVQAECREEPAPWGVARC